MGGGCRGFRLRRGPARYPIRLGRRAPRALRCPNGQPFGRLEEGETRGTGVAGTAELLARRLDAPEADGALLAELFELLGRALDSQPLRPLPGAAALIERVRARLPVAVASNAPRALLERAIDSAGLGGAFDVVLGADDVARPKPAPDLYATATRLLGTEARATVAFEDSAPGVASARAAGLYVVAVGDGGTLEADEHVESLADPRLGEWLGLDGDETN